MPIKTINVKYPPQNEHHSSFEEAKKARNQRLAELLNKRLEANLINSSNIETYWTLLEEMEGIQGADEGENVARQARLEIMRRLQAIDGTE